MVTIEIINTVSLDISNMYIGMALAGNSNTVPDKTKISSHQPVPVYPEITQIFTAAGISLHVPSTILTIF